MRDLEYSFDLWADAHVFFDELVQRPHRTGPLDQQATGWWQHMLNKTPNGELLTRNSLFDMLGNDRRLYLLHVTHAAESITQHGALYPSGGCLVGSIYCAPLIRESGGFRMHNLGEYVLTREAPTLVRSLDTDSCAPTPLVIEVTMPSDAYRGLAGIDYLRLGETHLRIFLHLEYLLSRAERHRIRAGTVSRVRNSMAFLSLCNSIVCDGTSVDAGHFLDLLVHAVQKVPILGYLYFEALAEYLMLHSTSRRTEELRATGEFDNGLYKELLFRTFPRRGGKFDLSKFRPTRDGLRRTLPKICPAIDIDHLTGYLADRLAFLVNARLFTSELVPGDWRKLRWEFNELRPVLGPLLGHLVHRELRTFGRYPDFYFYFDQLKALQVWNYWNHMDMVVPFNGTFPKGELGINPAYPDLKYKIWRARLVGDGRLEPVEDLDLRIAPRLVDIKYTLMRNNRWQPRKAPPGSPPSPPSERKAAS